MGLYNPIAGQSFDSLTDLSKQAGTDGVSVSVAYAATAGDRGGGTYRWDAASTLTANGMDVIAVTGQTIGRWIRMKNNNYTTGQVSFQTQLLVTSYTVNHGLGFTPSAIFLEPANDAASIGNRKITNINGTSFTITYSSTVGLIAGTATYYYLAVR